VTLTRLVIVLVAAAALVATGPALLDSGSGLRDQLSSILEDRGGGQSAEQISSGEFATVHGGMKATTLRSQVGAPAERTTSHVEGLKVECWYYGVAGDTGAYQFCFVDGRLSSKRRYAAPPSAE
jgi:hypothetical protein